MSNARGDRVKKQHVLSLFPADLRGSSIRKRALRLRRPELWAFYEELIWLLHDQGGEYTADPEALADEVEFWDADQVAEMLPLLKPVPGKLGGIVVDGGKIRQPRLDLDAAEVLEYKAARSVDGQRSAEARRKKYGTAQPVQKPQDHRRKTKVAEGTFGKPRRSPEPPFPSPTPSPAPTPERNTAPSADSAVKRSWSNEAAEDWVEVYGGQPPAQFFAQVKPIAKHWGWDRTRPTLKAYMRETPVEYLAIPKVLGGAFELTERRLLAGVPRAGPSHKTAAETTI